MWAQRGKERVGQTERVALMYTHNCVYQGFPGGSVANNLSANAGDARDVSPIPWSMKRHLLHYSCLENFMDRGACQATVHGLAKGQTGLSDVTLSLHFSVLNK